MALRKLACAVVLAWFMSAHCAFASEVDLGKAAYERGDYVSAFLILKPVADVAGVDRPEKFEAQLYLGFMFAKGQGVRQDYTQAVKWYAEAAKGRNALAQYNIGLAYIAGAALPQDYTKAMFWFREASKSGLPDAQAEIGHLYKYGLGIPKDEAEAWRWYRLAAAQNVAEAEYQVGVAYDEGRRVPLNYPSAVSWFKAAAEQGHGLALGRLGLTYELGLDGPPDLVAALTWYSLAEKMTPAKDAKARSLLEIAKAVVLKQMTLQQISASQQRVNDWLVLHGRK